eukprot:9183100-Pyramimonas_sp.AAC.1
MAFPPGFRPEDPHRPTQLARIAQKDGVRDSVVVILATLHGFWCSVRSQGRSPLGHRPSGAAKRGCPRGGGANHDRRHVRGPAGRPGT